jgi:hypothetical protein
MLDAMIDCIIAVSFFAATYCAVTAVVKMRE